MRGNKPKLQAIEGGLLKAPEPPEWLHEEGKAEWRRVIPDLVGRQVIKSADLASLENYCFAIGTIKRCQKQIATDGETVKARDGGFKRHPAFQTINQMMTESRRLAAELGLTPASRHKAGGGHAPEGEGDGDPYSRLGV
jgi:P27 family predicted phage terminase small subunit